MKILIVGMNPSTKPTLKGKSNATFKKLESWMSDCGIQHFSFVNTSDDVNKAEASNVDYKRLCTLSNDYDKIIALGGFASTALNKMKIKHFKMPHPSPRNRLLNDKAYECSMVKKCKEYINE